jgi:hypothetical protein
MRPTPSAVDQSRLNVERTKQAAGGLSPLDTVNAGYPPSGGLPEPLKPRVGPWPLDRTGKYRNFTWRRGAASLGQRPEGYSKINIQDSVVGKGKDRAQDTTDAAQPAETDERGDASPSESGQSSEEIYLDNEQYWQPNDHKQPKETRYVLPAEAQRNPLTVESLRRAGGGPAKPFDADEGPNARLFNNVNVQDGRAHDLE